MSDQDLRALNVCDDGSVSLVGSRGSVYATLIPETANQDHGDPSGCWAVKLYESEERLEYARGPLAYVVELVDSGLI